MHLRLHFSLFLLPIFLFAFSQSPVIVGVDAFVTFVLLHLFVYPSSNAYNSYHDQDIGSIGGLKNPPPVNHKVLILSNILDLIAIAAAFMVKMELSLYLLVYIIISRLYSNRKIRLKKYPYIGFSVIFIAQGAFTYFVCSLGVGEQWETTSSLTFFHSHIFALNRSNLSANPNLSAQKRFRRWSCYLEL